MLDEALTHLESCQDLDCPDCLIWAERFAASLRFRVGRLRRFWYEARDIFLEAAGNQYKAGDRQGHAEFIHHVTRFEAMLKCTKISIPFPSVAEWRRSDAN